MVRRALWVLAVALLAAGCGSGSGSSSGGSGGVQNGGTLRAGIPDDPDHLDTGISYAVEGWELLEATNNGLLMFKKASGSAGSGPRSQACPRRQRPDQ